ncbi:hypothetical protein [Komagataeibacter xylinus]|uniref:hypothetical protein n=1 Tax=Komagataeibacter xylinus TaxID=28448 RepID=UPI00280B0454|nr:hypothetical protein [Komagataeibacter xylinus]
MSADLLTNSPMVVEISPGGAATTPVSIQSVAFDQEGQMTVTLSDGTVLPPVACGALLAAAAGGKNLVAVDDSGRLWAGGKQIGQATAS